MSAHYAEGDVIVTFNIFGIDLYWKWKLFGFWIATIETENHVRSLLSLYRGHGRKLTIDLFWINIIRIYLDD